MADVAVDADVLIGFLDASDATHAEAVELLSPWLRPEHRVLVGASVLAEILVHPIRAGRADVVDDFLEGIRARVVPVDAGVARRAAGLRAGHPSLRLPDALSAAVAIESQATLLTLDERLRRALAALGSSSST